MTQSLKYMVALVRPHKLDDVVAALQREGIHGLIVSEARDYGQIGRTEVYRGARYTPGFQPMFKIEGTMPASQVDRIAETIASVARTGQTGDGRVIVFDPEHERTIQIDSALAAMRPRAA